MKFEKKILVFIVVITFFVSGSTTVTYAADSNVAIEIVDIENSSENNGNNGNNGNNNEDNNRSSVFPKTGERKKFFITSLGFLIVSIGAIVFRIKKFKN